MGSKNSNRNREDKKLLNNNEINIIININENDLNKEVYFLDDIDKWDDEIKIKPEHNKLTEMNVSNTELYINNKKYKFQKFFKFQRPGEYHIKIRLKFLIKDCGFMFFKCRQLTKIDLSNFNTANAINMERMFCCCENLIELNLSNFNTKNVTNMRSIFFGCKKLKEIDLSSFETENVNLILSMFNSCEILTSIDLSNFNTKKCDRYGTNVLWLYKSN